MEQLTKLPLQDVFMVVQTFSLVYELRFTTGT